jgi:imidazole glycerol-phosphate synthase subunit HisH
LKSPELVVIDNSGANLASVMAAFDRLGVRAQLSAEPRRIKAAQRVVLPGVGAAAHAMALLKRLELAELIPTLTQPVLGICLGMQLLMRYSHEGDTQTLGVMDADVEPLTASVEFPAPHMGWNQLEPQSASPLWRGLSAGDYVYFVHGYGVRPMAHTSATVRHGEVWSAAVEKDNFCGLQFHPERSRAVGAKVLSNFLSWSP